MLINSLTFPWSFNKIEEYKNKNAHVLINFIVINEMLRNRQVIIFLLAMVLSMSLAQVNLIGEEKYKEIAITAEKYKFTPDIIELKKGETVILSISSEDVNHGFCSKELNIYLEVPAGEEVKYKFTPAKEGTFEFYCCVYCGPGHKKMKGKIIVKA